MTQEAAFQLCAEAPEANASAGGLIALPVNFTGREQAVLDAARRRGLHYQSSRARYKGHTIVFHTGVIGDLQVIRMPRRQMISRIMRLLAQGSAQ